MGGAAAVGVEGQEQRSKNTALRGTGADGSVFSQFYPLLPVRQEV